jgi:glycosyltransferase involved in cell wall biosynthesis
MVPKYFSIADVVVLPYLRTSGSGVANIAMSYGKPILTSDLETMRECLADYEGAMFAPPGDSQTIAEELVKIYDLHGSGKVALCGSPRNTSKEVARQYERIIEQLGTKYVW